jgi:hypothetical protein
MKPRHPTHYLVVTLLAMAAGAAMAQPPGLTRYVPVDGAGPLSSNLILERWTRAIERDLKISDDVAEKLALVRAEYRAALQKAYEDAGINPNKISTGEQINTDIEITRKLLGEFIPKAAALLSPDQITRLGQIDLQLHFRLVGPGALIRVASALKLTNDQRRTLSALSRDNRGKQGFDRAAYLDKAIGVLTDEQKETFNKLKGEEFSQFNGQRPGPPAGAENAQQKGTMPIYFPVRFPSVELVHFAAIEAVQKDLGVSEEVARKLTLLRDDYRATYQKECQAADILQSPGPFNAALPKLREIGKNLDDEFTPKVSELLSADQQKRLQQIRFQGRLKNLGFAALSDVGSELKLTDDQLQKLRALAMEYRQRQRENAPNGPNDREAAARPSKVKEEFLTKAVELLSAEQKATLDKLKGSEFDTSQLVIR